MLVEAKVSGRELRRAYKRHAEDLKAFTGAAAQDLTTLQADLKATRELCADLSERLEASNLAAAKLQGTVMLFITQDWTSRLKWLVGR